MLEKSCGKFSCDKAMYLKVDITEIQHVTLKCLNHLKVYAKYRLPFRSLKARSSSSNRSAPSLLPRLSQEPEISYKSFENRHSQIAFDPYQEDQDLPSCHLVCLILVF